MSKNNPNKGEMVTKARQQETKIAELEADRDAMRTQLAEVAARQAQQSMVARVDLENPGQESRPVANLYGIYDERKTSLRQSVIEELEARNLHWEFVIDDHTSALSEYIHPGSLWEIFKDAEGKEVRVPASPSDASQELVLVVVDKGAFDAVTEQAVRADKLRRAGALKLQPNEYVGQESTVFKG